GGARRNEFSASGLTVMENRPESDRAGRGLGRSRCRERRRDRGWRPDRALRPVGAGDSHHRVASARRTPNDRGNGRGKGRGRGKGKRARGEPGDEAEAPPHSPFPESPAAEGYAATSPGRTPGGYPSGRSADSAH